MNKLFYVLPILALTACNHTPNYCNEYRCDNYYTGHKAYRGESYTVSKPVEVLYKNTTYTTVYEPRTYEEVSYERKPYRGEGCYRVRGKNYCN